MTTATHQIGDTVNGFEDGTFQDTPATFTVTSIDKYFVSCGRRVPQWKGWKYNGYNEVPYGDKVKVQYCSKIELF